MGDNNAGEMEAGGNNAGDDTVGGNTIGENGVGGNTVGENRVGKKKAGRNNGEGNNGGRNNGDRNNSEGNNADRNDDDQRAITVHLRETQLRGDLTMPAAARGIVVFAHGTGSSRHSPRNRYVAHALVEAGFATLLIDLLTLEEEQVDRRTREWRFDIPLLASRLTGAVDWLGRNRAGRDSQTSVLPVVTFGASTGAAAALITAAERPEKVRGVISRGGRADLAGDALKKVSAPVLLIVGSNDPIVIEMNEQAASQLTGDVETEIVSGATHLFEEPGALDTVIEHALGALNRWLPA